MLTHGTCSRTTLPAPKDDRCGLAKALEFVKSSDVLVVWKLDRLGRSLSHLLSIVNELKDRQVAFRSLDVRLFTHDNRFRLT